MAFRVSDIRDLWENDNTHWPDIFYFVSKINEDTVDGIEN